ncbi:ATP-binding cassette sub-family G member 4-like [Oppia nitens]|uniref:ATP-binding cassette sub-family G member 4-like n=1 Tax=Oppia nitens TaxID=1686743 RepID=UPI0023DB648F|nr:ATP-binding cassette sub-family G member 4-like [Oppia nitens]
MVMNYCHKNEMAMAWLDMCCVQNSLFCGPSKTILNSLNGCINFHTLTALMGPSGAGKTTLLKCINMRPNCGLTSDSQMFVNKYTDLRTCFIMQSSDEHLFMGLTVRESLLFASRIKNRSSKRELNYRDSYAQTGTSLLNLNDVREDGSDESYESTAVTMEKWSDPYDKNGNFDHNMNIMKILQELLLEDCADNAVHTCSGGEQKRLSVGLELVQQIKPNLLCIDEPTSGLDSNASEMVIQCLKQLSDRHRMAIVTSIHQPNSLLLSMFDQLYVLSKGGHCVFAGRPNHLRDHLTTCDINCAEDILPIEMLLKISSKFPNNSYNKYSKTNGSNNVEDETMTINNNNNEIDRLIDITIKQVPDIVAECQTNGRFVSKSINKHTKYFNFYHFYYLLMRGITCFIRSEWRVSAALATFSIVVAVMLIYLYGTDIGQENGCMDLYAAAVAVANRTPTQVSSLEQSLRLLSQESKVSLNLKCQFFVVVFLQFVSMACTILVFPSEVRIFLNEHHNKWYSTSSYFWSKFMLEIPVSIVISYVYSFIIYYGTGQLSDAYRYAYFTLIVTFGMSIANSAGTLVGIIFARSFQVATTSGVVLFLVLVLLSGFFVPLTIQHEIIRSSSYLSFIKLTFEAIMVSIYGIDRCESTQISIMLHQLELNDDDLTINSYWIVGHLIVWRLLALLALIYRANDWSIANLIQRQNKAKQLTTTTVMTDNKSITFTANYLNTDNKSTSDT